MPQDRLRYLLLQARNPDDPMRGQEVACFAGVLGCDAEQIRPQDLILYPPSAHDVASADVVLLGGSGDHSVAAGGDWLPRALDCMRDLHHANKPTFASCWGFQAMARAMGGEVLTDPHRAELGTLQVRRTTAAAADPVFKELGSVFTAQMGHQDIVERLPENALLLASTDRVQNQAFTFADKAIYCTQFHPELNRRAFLERVRAYPSYVESIARMSYDEFERRCADTPESSQLLRRFIELVFG